jgi:hypothetical protein
MVKIWKHSRLRYYLKNLYWNYSFWLHAKPVYKDFHYTTRDNLDMNAALNTEYVQVNFKSEKKLQKRFSGFMYKGKIYQDNPGIQGIDKETWDAWIKKKLIQL